MLPGLRRVAGPACLEWSLRSGPARHRRHRSTPAAPGRRLVEDAALVLDAAGADAAALLGISAGGPLPASGATAMPGRARSLLLVAPLGPPGWPVRGMAPRGWLSLAAARRAPAFGGWFLGRLAALARRSPRLFLRLAASELPAADRRALEQAALREAFLAGYLEAFRRDSWGVAQDLRLLTRPWGFELGSIPGADIDPPRRRGHHRRARARPALRQGDTRRAASPLPRPRSLLDPRRRPADAGRPRRIGGRNHEPLQLPERALNPSACRVDGRLNRRPLHPESSAPQVIQVQRTTSAKRPPGARRSIPKTVSLRGAVRRSPCGSASQR